MSAKPTGASSTVIIQMIVTCGWIGSSTPSGIAIMVKSCMVVRKFHDASM